jgi:hypothetical protein
MADLSKLKQIKTQNYQLGTPPSLDEASLNLLAPEVAPVAPAGPEHTTAKAFYPGSKRDGRTARRTHRTVQFATRVTPEWDERIRWIAEQEGALLVEILERALVCYENREK